MIFTLGFWIGVAAGGAAVWFGKDTITKWVVGAEAFAANLQAKAAAISATVKKL